MLDQRHHVQIPERLQVDVHRGRDISVAQQRLDQVPGVAELGAGVAQLFADEMGESLLLEQHIAAAADRLAVAVVPGNRPDRPARSSCCNSLPKQGDKLWVLTHKYPDLREEFAKQRDDVSGIPQAFQHLQARVLDLDLDSKTLRAENADLTTRANTYAQVIQESTAEPDPRRTEPLSSVCLVPTQAERG